MGPDDCDCVTTGELADSVLRCSGVRDAYLGRTAMTEVPHEANFLKLDCSKAQEGLWLEAAHCSSIDSRMAKNRERYRCVWYRRPYPGSVKDMRKVIGSGRIAGRND